MSETEPRVEFQIAYDLTSQVHLALQYFDETPEPLEDGLQCGDARLQETRAIKDTGPASNHTGRRMQGGIIIVVARYDCVTKPFNYEPDQR